MALRMDGENPSEPRACVLVVDDEAPLREVLNRSLGREGYRVLLARDGREALSILDSGESVDLVVTDIAMPVMNGLELARRVRAGYPGVAILLMTGCLDQPPSGWEHLDLLRKPFRLVELSAEVRRLLGGALPPTPRPSGEYAGPAAARPSR